MIAKYGSFEYALADRYRFEAELGRGAMGAVYRARDLKLDRVVAIKMLHATLTNDLGILRFQSEIRIAASLHHPSIVAIHDSGEADGRLFYVMEHLDGETLRARLNREKQLSVDDALAITEQIADALQFAHDRGVVHRDIKPENILLADGRARVVDFGLARALGDVDGERLTASGLSVGTPQYLSPEQAAAEREVGPRADQYSLACVLYEMLAGEPPFTGPTATAVAMRHISEIPAPLRNRRRTTPMAVEASVMRALEKVPADRFATMRELVAGLRGAVPAFGTTGSNMVASTGSVPLPHKRRIALPYVVAAGLLTVAAIGMIGAAVVRFDDPAGGGFGWWAGRSLDTTRYAVLPFASAVPSVGAGLDDKIRDALSRWDGISVAGGPEMQAAAGGRGGSAVTANDGRAIARAVGAGRYVMGEVTADGGGVRIRAEALDAAGRTTARSASVVAPSGRVTDSVVSHLIYQLLYSGDEARRDEGDARGTGSRMAFADYLTGRNALRTWNLVRADSDFTAALRSDPSFGQAALSLASVRDWQGSKATQWRALVRRALDGRNKLTDGELAYAQGLDALSGQRLHDACTQFERLVAVDSTNFGAWYGLGECNRGDRVVVSDRATPSGKSFRGSLNRSIVAMSRAFELLPAVDSCCVERAMAAFQHPLIVTTHGVVAGVGLPPDTMRYAAYPQLMDDTIGLVPRPYRGIELAPPATYTAAVHRMRDIYFGMAARRLAMFPRSARALAALGEAMELRSDRGAADTVHRARVLAANLSDSIDIGADEIWLRLKYAVPSDLRELAAIRSFADSLLSFAPRAPANVAASLASVAALVGNTELAARLSSRGNLGLNPDFPSDITSLGNAYVTLAGMGGPVDSLRAAENRLLNAIKNEVDATMQATVRNQWIGQAAGLAYPVYRSPHLGEVSSGSDYLIDAEASHARGDNRAVERILAQAARARAVLPAADVTLDVVYPESWLLAAIGDTTAALRLLGSSLDAIRDASSRQFESPENAGALVQAMMLRAQLEKRIDPASAHAWEMAVRAVSDMSVAGRTLGGGSEAGYPTSP